VRRLIVFNSVSLDGYFTDRHGEMSWAHASSSDAEWNAFVSENASGGGVLVFGRITYEMMASFWPTPAAAQAMPAVAERMNALPKVVFSRTLTRAAWANTQLVTDDVTAAMRTMKALPGDDMVILGSGRLVCSLAEAGLIDEYQLVMTPVVLGGGRTMFDGLGKKLALKRTKTRAFGNGNVLLCYEPH
jgi:dihydrofolate reductase